MGSCTASCRPVGASLPSTLGVSEVYSDIIFAAAPPRVLCIGTAWAFAFCSLFFPIVFQGFFFPPLPVGLGATSIDTCLYLLRNLA